MKHIHVSTGDSNGVGLEVTLKALNSLKKYKDVQFFIWRENKKIPAFLKKEYDLLKKKYRAQNLTEVLSRKSPALQFKEISALCAKNPQNTALVTAPLSKKLSQKYGFKGHTDFLRQNFSKDIFMCFLGDHFNVVLLTDHQPLSKLCLNARLLKKALEALLDFKSLLGKNNKPIGVLGLNPHAGEGGILGFEEERILKPLLKKYKKKVKGPLVPDVCFQSQYWSQYSFYLCMYHDQGLIPFKMIHKFKGVQVTLGLPFVRTSVDHGTAFDIYGKNKAQKTSMKKALETALYLLSKR